VALELHHTLVCCGGGLRLLSDRGTYVQGLLPLKVSTCKRSIKSRMYFTEYRMIEATTALDIDICQFVWRREV